ncbi:unnamed protein product [Adineta steineri]|uniref:carnitine O-palmitoyltransferase n=1 Tax=Adineta steineri TaxID=433720 RepID=A0A814S2I8_9BILA|nr:unnamed protein product [Adineta steineri]CAF0969702.1 unnamed protein product [Adineta steineri]CAF1052823.1 unnamed protein product [Adineta steineri]CAF1141261.1 unnamed protein product [Adineta steineri]CAF3579853.1 unnamed protein product [Adineta steineri]
MAEAHEAVAFSFTVGPEGFNVDVSYDVFKALIYSGARSWRLRCRRTLNSLYNSLYPGHPLRGIACCGIVSALYFNGHDPSFNIIDWLNSHVFQRYLAPKNAKIVACITFGAGVYIVLIQVRQYTLKKLFSYHGWMYQEHGKQVSLMPKIWAGLVRLCVGRNPSLYSCQNLLPTLPVPNLDDTLQRYLRSVRPLYDDEEYSRMEKLAEEFKHTIGRRLQRYLWLKWLISSNYVSDWWEKFVYLRGRSPIMVNSNFYGLDEICIRPTTIQAARAANITCSAFRYRSELEVQNVKPVMVQKVIPLCSSQYERQFNTVRIPGKDADKIIHYPDSHHIAVYHKGRWYKVFMYYQNNLLQPCELQLQLDEIIRDTTPPAYGEEHLAALTAGERTLWAEARETYFRSGVNRSSLEAIEKAAFILVLDDEEFEIGTCMTGKFDEYAHAILHGKGYDRWFDKSFNFIISKNAVFGFNVEHSWADAPISGHMVEYVLSEDLLYYGYDELGNTCGTPRFTALKPVKLKFTIPESCNAMIEKSLTQATKLYNDVDLHVYVQDAYGKGFMKKCKLSPDAYIQMALQLAHYRDSGHFNLTYEASMTRLFRDGRTETVRSCSIESSLWVKAMEDPAVTKAERIKLLRIACDYHQQQYRDAMTGKGIDRHLFCLYVISKFLGLDSPFLQQVLQEPWKLSTSQTPTLYDDKRLAKLVAEKPEVAEKIGWSQFKGVVGAGGGFGPVAADGYGVSYIITSEDLIFFHISSTKSSPETDSRRFGQRIYQAMQDMRDLFDGQSTSTHTSKK